MIRRKSKKLGLWAAVVLVLQIALLAGPAPPASASMEDVALFYDALATLGTWVTLANYGPVWYPSGVGADWRPYINGRWVPAPEGWVFETNEPWGWATYHYGNWMPTSEYGWVWAPGRTWYPSTVAWRNNADYIGWAPIPPPDYAPEPAFYPEGGYYPGTPVLDLITAPFWLFAEAASFLLGFGQPFLPAYSYYGCGCLAPFDYVPFLYPRTFFFSNFFYPGYAPGGFYAFGPPFEFVSQVTNIHLSRIHNFANTASFLGMNNVLPPPAVLERHPFLRQAIPDPLLRGQRFPVTAVSDPRQAVTSLTRPDIMTAPLNVPPLRAQIPQAVQMRPRVGPEALSGIRGMQLPSQAVRETPQMREQIRQHQLGEPGRMATAAPAQKPVEIMRPQGEVRPPHMIEAPGAPGRPPTMERPQARPESRPAPRGEFGPSPRLAAPAPRESRPTPQVSRPTPRQEFWATPREQRAIPREFRAAPAPAFHGAPQVSRPAPQPAPAARPAPAPRPAAPSAPHEMHH
jgi:hypothetical protein